MREKFPSGKAAFRAMGTSCVWVPMCAWGTSCVCGGGYVLVAFPPNLPVLGSASVRMCRGIQEEDGWGYLTSHDT
jgi:hypothetical protein